MNSYNQKTIPCEICAGDKFELLQSRGRIGKAGEYGPLSISICKFCGFIFQNPRYEDAFYKEYYKKLYREVTFESTLPSNEYVETQIVRGAGVLAYLEKFIDKKGSRLYNS